MAGAIYIAGSAFAAMLVVARTRDTTRARLLVSDGVITGLSIKLAATLLKTIELHTWEQISLLAAVLALRTLLKRVFVWEQGRLKGEKII